MIPPRKVLVYLALLFALAERGVVRAEDSSSNQSRDIVHASPLFIVNPEFSKNIKTKRRRGEVELRATIGPDGTVKKVVALGGDSAVSNAAANAVQQWRYLPAMRNSAFIESTEAISINYDLDKHTCAPREPAEGAPRAPAENLLNEIAMGRIVRPPTSGVTAPNATYAPGPEYSESARQQKLQGNLELGIVVGTDGRPQDIWVVRPLGAGLDEEAIRAVKQWKFSPATRGGQAVPAVMGVELSFTISTGCEPEFVLTEKAPTSD